MSETTAPSMPSTRVSRWIVRPLSACLITSIVAERERWPLWMPVLVGSGIAAYFALPTEPPGWIGAGALLVLSAVAALRRRHATALTVGLVGGMLAGGFAVAQLRAESTAAPVLAERYGPAPVVGLVTQVEEMPAGPRVTLERVTLEGYATELTPRRVRITLRRSDRVRIGSTIDVLARLAPPFSPVMPGAFDFQRSSWFKGLGATGFALAPARILAADDPKSARLLLADFRYRVAERTRLALAGQTGAVAAALMTGDRSAISRPTLYAMRDSGLAHLLAISGLHLGLVAATLFFGSRALLASSERLALRHPIKKWAAVLALAGSFGYLLLAGAPIPTQRAFLMTGLVLIAVIVDREAISMRLVAWAAVLVLAAAPESLLGASFQMSFAAVVALVAFYEVARDRLQTIRAILPDGLPGRILAYAAGVAATTVVASVATGLIGLHHFGRVAVYGLAANMLAVPITALWIMPSAVIAALLMPFGLEGPALAAMGAGIDFVLSIATTVSSWPGAVRHVPAMPTGGLVLTAMGGLWLCLWRCRWRYFGLVAILAGVATIPLARGPDIILSGDARLMAVRMGDGQLSLSDPRGARFQSAIWLERNGQSRIDVWPAAGESPDGGLTCDSIGCIYRIAGLDVALLRDGRALDEDCRRADILISAVPVRGRCPYPRWLIDRFDIWRGGGTALWVDETGVQIRTVAEAQGARPWSSLARRTPRRRGDPARPGLGTQ
ncbi:MAG: ComEC/Rec2 family competence protein [Rhodospirillales bacterium]|nr:MAG: ComEC/Rec2 family competence protein [Rhodospirillales bacterium]